MPLSPAQWGRLRTAALSGDPAILVWRRGDTLSEAVLVSKRRNGYMMAVPQGLLTQEEREAAQQGQFAEALGPTHDVTVMGVSMMGRAEQVECNVTLVDLTVERCAGAELRAEGPLAPAPREARDLA